MESRKGKIVNAAIDAHLIDFLGLLFDRFSLQAVHLADWGHPTLLPRRNLCQSLARHPHHLHGKPGLSIKISSAKLRSGMKHIQKILSIGFLTELACRLIDIRISSSLFLMALSRSAVS